MTVRKVNLYSLCVFAIFPAVILWKSIVEREVGFEFLFASLFTIIAWGIGIFLGLVLAVVVKRPPVEPYLYLSAQLSILLAIVTFTVITIHTDREKERAVANIRSNHNFVDLDARGPDLYRLDYIRTAFRKLESKSGDPNSFHLEKYSSRWKDTVINSSPDTIFSVLFTYLKNDKVLFAKITVLDDSAVINSIDADTKPDQPFTGTGAWGRPTDLEEIKSKLKDLPDSTRKRIIDILSQ